ncbi:NAD(P)-dependent oxidoreductase [Diaphorobacter sp. HDW4A]|uniref:NAD(P)-dependent oxidoreductase n=1 Tax=Diaphorobacter sp. HDW4A TaxID=2714924 RepID=UPI001408D2B8|nr:NAD(P)-dependent oxidoreductase [Diaphorobacter sp. HDW4A]QIL79962.1 NAD(P)-dependent oxidoreductase [Diaphorobacter sp. HDW4A]
MPTLRNIGWFGLGNMGAPMVANLLNAGLTVTACDLNPANAAPLQSIQGFHFNRSAAETVADKDAIVCMLPDSKVVDAVIWGQRGIAQHLREGSVVIDMGSSNPANSKVNAERLLAQGIHFVDAPVSGGIKRAINGTLSVMAGGSLAAFELAQPLLAHLGGSIIRVGEAGAGHAVKALNNYVSAAGLIAVSEALVAAQRFGIDPHLVNQVFNVSSGKNATTELKVEPSMLSGTYDYGFALKLMRKDVATAEEFITAMNIADPFVRSVLQISANADDALGPRADHTAVHAYIASRH